MLEGAMGSDLARLCITKLSAFLEDQDQNRKAWTPTICGLLTRIILPVKYIALLALTKIVPTHPRLVADHQTVILASVDDFDISIRMRALDLISAMVRPEHPIYETLPLNELPGHSRECSISGPATALASRQTQCKRDPSICS